MKVSVITPSYNQGQFIERTLRSVCDQQSLGLVYEHVVFDGGSNDDTLEILSSFDHDVRWVSESDRGQAHAVNKGICATDGDIIGWLNSDDVYYPGVLARVVDFFEEHPDVDAVYGMADHIDVNDVAFEPYPTEPWDPARLMDTCYICQPALFFRRRVVVAYGLLDESLQYCMDYEYWLRLARHGVRFAYLPEKLAGSRLYSENKTMSDPVAVHKEINEMLRRYGPVPDAWLFNYAYVVVRSKVDEQERPARFAREVTLRSLLASFRWNGRISHTLVRRLFPRLRKFS
jgi:glycosyltransferase involved in cell wall biosynthesis